MVPYSLQHPILTMRPCWVKLAVLIVFIQLLNSEGKANRYIDVNGDEGTIDQLHDYMTSHRTVKAHTQGPRQDAQDGGKIEFGVGPDDPRFFRTYSKDVSSSSLPKYVPESFNYPLRKEYPQNDLLNALPQDPALYQQPGEYRGQDEFQYPGIDFAANNYPNILVNYPAPKPHEKARHSVNLNSNTYETPQDHRLLQKQQWQEQILATNKLANKQTTPHKQVYEDKKDISEVAGDKAPPVNYLQRDEAFAKPPQYNHHAVPNDDLSRPAQISDFTFTVLVAASTTVAVCGVVGAGICWYRLHKNQRATADAEYPAYGVTGPSKDLSPGAADRKLAQSAHMYHYQHQKQQMIALDKSSGGERQGSASDVDTDDEGEEGDYTVYECPGLASTGEMEVKNPLFQDEPTPATPALTKEQCRDTPDPQED